ncbi:hypothetical protein D3Y55_12030 [Mesorhizobium sp. DCY119]|nr:hypothetical protein D3Y55_12030 [Mesorhizobium sp. DCY119]
MAFLEDANEDSSITDATYRVLQKIVAAFNRKNGYSECARTFIVDRVPISVKTVQRARKALLADGRISIVREPAGRASTRYGVNWWFRGADTVRSSNFGKPILDCRTHSVEGTFVSHQNDNNVPSSNRRGDMMSPKPFLPLKGKERAISDAGALPLRAAPRAMAMPYVAVVTEAVVEAGTLWLSMAATDGSELMLDFVVDNPNDAVREIGLGRLRVFCAAAGVREDVKDADELVGARVSIFDYGTEAVRVMAAPATDAHTHEKAA